MILFGSSRYWKIHEDSHFSSKYAQIKVCLVLHLAIQSYKCVFLTVRAGAPKKSCFCVLYLIVG